MTAGDSHLMRSPVGGPTVELVVRPASDDRVGRGHPVWAAVSDLTTLTISTWAHRPGPLLSGLRPRRCSDHMPKPARDLHPQVYLQGGLRSLRVV
ncbi:hypothetical protein N7492_008280 [Penicillium capsulatum]|uniref:Uncharacterized protein n=1 Tax=Penicillium capsulatum TaxID=69766 RepID=A0A9W9HRE1_9EURO|nr:hypothetical protein N7492_008280 [Penicillium capsulatum]KAJ6105690.1 hypothetical protein N7512_009207 [Penicillium capsulatum]